MSEVINDINGNPVTVFTRTTPEGYIDAICRADNKAAWEAAALSQGLYVAGESDPMPAPGVNVDILGPVVLTPGIYDEDHNEITAAVMDNRYHVNLRIAEPMLSKVNSAGFERWKVTAINWTLYGVDVAANAAEAGKELGSVTLIDPDTISSPSRGWAG